MMNTFAAVSPLKLLEKTSRRQLGKGNMGVLIARAGVGKTACLIHIALDKIFRQEKLIHVSLEESPDKTASYYDVIFSDLVKNKVPIDEREYRSCIEKHRVILAYLNRSFDTARLATSLTNLKNELDFPPDTLIVDGLDFENAERRIFEGLEEIATGFQVEIWLSALSHRHIRERNENGIPYPCHGVDGFFSIIMQLTTGSSGVFLQLLKDHDHPLPDETRVRLDPGTFLSMPAE